MLSQKYKFIKNRLAQFNLKDFCICLLIKCLYEVELRSLLSLQLRRDVEAIFVSMGIELFLKKFYPNIKMSQVSCIINTSKSMQLI